MTTLSRRTILATALLSAIAGLPPSSASIVLSMGARKAPEELRQLLYDPLRLVSSDLCELALSGGRYDFAYSPLGLLQALVSLQQAASGYTAKLFKAHRFGDARVSMQDVGDLLKSLQEVPEGLKAGLKLETGLFLSSQVKVKPAFASSFANAPGFSLQQLDFQKDGGAAAASSIAAWLASKTGVSPGGMAKLDADTKLYIASALAFRMAWLRAFDPERTRSGTFQQLDGKQVLASFMSMEAELLRMEDKSFEAVDLRYENTRFGLVLILPKENRRSRSGQIASMASVLRRLDLQGHGGWAGRFEPEDFMRKKVTLAVPRFEVTAELDAKALLEQTRLRPVLGRAASYGAVTDENLELKDFRQSVSITVREQGTEAVARTTASVDGRGLAGVMTFDRPFIWLLRDTTTNIDLMKGFVGSAASLLPPPAQSTNPRK